MGFMETLKRIPKILEANLNDLLDKAEDPEKMIDQYLRNLEDDYAEYMLQFTVGGDWSSFSWPGTIKWVNDIEPSFNEGSTYQISILNGLGVWAEF